MSAGGLPGEAAYMERAECGRCGAEVRPDKKRHFCGEGYPLRATDNIVRVRYVSLADPAAALRAVLREPGARAALRAMLTSGENHEAGIEAMLRTGPWRGLDNAERASHYRHNQAEETIAAYLSRVFSVDALASGETTDD